MTYVYLSGEDVLGIAGLAVEDRHFVVRDVGLVAAAAHRPSATPLGREAYIGCSTRLRLSCSRS